MSSESANPTDPLAATVGDTRAAARTGRDDEDDDFGLDDSLLRAVAAAPPIPVQGERLSPGDVVGESFRVESVLGAGAMGVVYEAFDLTLDRRVALKLHARDSDDVRTSRMWREAKAMARLAHPNVIAVHEVGEHEGRVFIAMELVEGGTLRDWLDDTDGAAARSWREVLRVFIQAAQGLAAAHAVELIHRDFKPDNILIGQDGRVRVADFGLARGAADEPELVLRMRGDLTHSPSVDDRLTQTGASVGTPAYMAPEQMAGLEIDHRCDQFSFCVALYEALYGHRPFDGPTLADLAEAIENGRVRSPPSDRLVPGWLHAVVLRGLSPRPELRFPAMEQLLEALRADPSRRRRRVLLGAGVVAAVGFTAWVTRVASVAETPCRDVGAEMATIWSPEVASRVEQALRDTGSDLAEDAILRVRPALDDYAERWASQRAEACRATRVGGQQSESMLDRRMVCLDRRRQQVEAVVAVLSTPDAAVVKNAVQTLGVLGSLEACADLEALQAQYPPPDDEATRAAVAEVRADMETIIAASMAGRGHTKQEDARAVVERALALGHPPLLAEAHFTRHSVTNELGEREPSIADAVAAHRFSAQSGDARLAWRSCLSLAQMVGRTAAGTDEALRWLETAEGWAERASLDAYDVSYAHRARAEVYQQGDRLEDSLAELQRSLDALSGEEPGSGDLAETYVGLAYVLRRLSRFEDARRYAVQGIEQLEVAYGPRHPLVAKALSILAHVEHAVGDDAAALEAIERGLELRRSGIGEDSLSFASTLRERGDILGGMGRLEDAIADYERSLELLSALEHREPREELMTSNNLAIALSKRGDDARALELVGRTLDRAIDAFGAKSARVAQIRINYGNELALAGRHEEAIAQCRMAAESLTLLHGPGHVEIGIARLNLAQSHLALSQLEDARLEVERAQEGFAQSLPPTHLWSARAAAVEAELLEAEGRRADARSRWKEAADLLEGTLGPAQSEVVRARRRAAEISNENGEPAKATERLDAAHR